MAMLDDSEFRTNHEIDFEQPVKGSGEYANKHQVVHIYGSYEDAIENRINHGIYPHRINVEFSHTDSGGNEQMADLYFHPEDLERLGVLFQYEAKRYMQLRDELEAAKVEKEQQQQQPRKRSILR